MQYTIAMLPILVAKEMGISGVIFSVLANLQEHA
jgi:hypothetical protein